MREDLRECLGEEETCPYLEGERAQMRYRLMSACRPEDFQRLLERGWRRFGRLFFRPACRACRQCRSLRVDVGAFEINRSRRRTLAKNRDLRVTVQRPSASKEHLALYGAYHGDMARRKGWKEKSIGLYEYHLTFVEGDHVFAHEILVRQDERLVCVALVDILPRAVSAVYCYYDPELRSRSLGVFSILQQIELARRHGIPHLYLGYWVEGNESMRYKATYNPHELLEGRPETADPAVWRAKT